MKAFALLFSLIFISACSSKPVNTATESQKARALMDQFFDAWVDRSPQFQTYLGIKKDQDKWKPFTEERAREDHEMAKSQLAQLHKINPKHLDEATRLSYQLMEENLKEDIEGYEWRYHYYPVNTMGGMHTDLVAFLINNHQVTDEKDARAYLARLNGIASQLDQLQVQLKLREEKGILPPQFVFARVRGNIAELIKGSEPLTDFRGKVNKLKDLKANEKANLVKEAETAIKVSMIPAMKQLDQFLADQEKRATTDDGVWKLPRGDQYYAFQLEKNTTTKYTPDEVHSFGLAEVKRIHSEMDEIRKKVGFKGDLKAFFKHLKTASSSYYPNNDGGRKQYIADTILAIRGIEKKVPEYFGLRPEAPVDVKRVEAFREKTSAAAFYQGPSPDGSRPGRFYVNLKDMKAMPKYELEALAYHEAVPGHHLQITIATELKDVPKFQKFNGYSAYSEGWGLYSELLAKEMGFYKDAYADFGRLAAELWRSIRLVVDTGIHAQKWTREQAIAYMQNESANADEDIVREIERYIGWPGQATSYKIGMRKILELRARAQEKLGHRFQFSQFHDEILRQGAMPLGILEQRIDSWIKKNKS